MSLRPSIIMLACIDVTESNACVSHVAGIANGFAQLGYSVNLLVPSPHSADLAMPIKDNVNVIYFCKSLENIPNALKVFFALPHIVKLRSIKPVLFYTRFSLLNFLALFTAKIFLKAPLMSEHNGLIGEEIAMNSNKLFPVWLADKFQYLDCLLSTHVRVVTAGIGRRLSMLGNVKDKIFVAGNGTDLSMFVAANREIALVKNGLNPNKKYVGFIGNLAAWQGVSFLLDAYTSIANRYPDWDLLIVGGGAEYDRLVEQANHLGISSRVVFTGNVPIKDAPSILSCFDIATSPAIKQRNADIGTESIKVRDYSATGRAILTSRIPGYAELEELDVIMCHNADDVEDIASKLVTLMDNQNLRDRLMENSLEYAQGNFSWTNISRKCLSRAGLIN